ncbi:MAG: metal-dependent hydrolase [Pseudomonadota bacterium]
MANFRTHIGIGTIATGFLATITMAAAVVTPNQVMSLALAGALGSVLPDIDLQRSRSSRAIFFVLALFFSFCALFSYGWKYSILEMWLIWLAVFLGVRYIGQALFHRFAVHRGVFHSILAGVFFMFAATVICYHILDVSAELSWLAGFFVLFGYIVHLLLDEIYSVDFDNTRIKRSFGSAFKLYEYKSIGASLAMLVAAILAFYIAPSSEAFIKSVSSEDMWLFVWQKLLPDNGLFGWQDQLQKMIAFFYENSSDIEPNL